jgi:4-amino-4-deoxy-L-arabinose transferase-like glycosyltransferase
LSLHFNKFNIALLAIILTQIVVNLVGTLGPELGFDALWYHLTMPKIYLQENKIFYIGGHLYYSAMPQLTEMYYLVSLALGNEIIAKLIHFLFGLLSLIALYKMSRLYFSIQDSVLVALIYYSNLVVGWMSITAYIDLTRAFFEIMALWAFLYFVRFQKFKWLIISAILVGFAASTKILSVASVILYLLLLIYLRLYKFIVFYATVAIAVVSPWLIYSYYYTRSPVYPLFSSSGFAPNYSFSKVLQIFLFSADPISPIYLILLPLIGLLFIKKLSLTIRLLIIYVLFNTAILFLAPVESSGRFIIPYLPGFTLLFWLLLKSTKNKFLYNFIFIIVIIIALSSIAYRGFANKRFIPYLLGKVTLPEFMTANMEFQVGNFYDIDGYFQKTIKPEDKVLIYGISNLFYVNFPYIHESWLKSSDKFNYILLKDYALPEKYKDWKLVYQNPISHVLLYSPITPKK